MYSLGNGLDQIQIQLDFETWILMDLDLIDMNIYLLGSNRVGLYWIK